MHHSYLDGKICLSGEYYEQANYNVSNDVLSVIFDGKGGVGFVNCANKGKLVTTGTSCVHIDGEHIDVFCKKTVEMIGRIQEERISTAIGELRIRQFLDSDSQGIYLYYDLQPTKEFNTLQAGLYLNSFDQLKVACDGNIQKIDEATQLQISLTKNQLSARVFMCFDEGFDERTSIDFDKIYNGVIAEIESIRVPENLTE